MVRQLHLAPITIGFLLFALFTSQAGAQDETEKSSPTLSEILLGNVDQRMLLSENMPAAKDYPAPELDEAKLRSFGLRKMVSRHVTIWTDIDEADETSQLASQFDDAVSSWASYFRVPDDKVREFQVIAYLMANEGTFKEAGLIPADLPKFLHGFQRGYELWVRDQPSAYYRRHLLLHEGVHGFMNILLEGTGPPWYREGIAEHLATHRLDNGRVRVGVMPASREEVPYWGRIKLLRDQFAAGEAKMMNEVMQLTNADFLENEGYAWAWAAVAYLDGHPSYRNSFRQLTNHLNDNPVKFSRRLLDQFAARLRQFDEQWQLFIVNADYGYDFAAETVKYQLGVPLSRQGKTIRLKVDRGWQSSGVRVVAGKLYRVTASGQYQIRKAPEQWWSEPSGVTLTYYRGVPLGALIGAIRLDESREGVAGLADPIAIGRQRHLRPMSSGTLYLRINDFPGETKENVGEIKVKITEVKASKK